MKKTQIIISIFILTCMLLSFASCSGADKGENDIDFGYAPEMGGHELMGTDGTSPENAGKIFENAFIKVSDEATSTLSADVDTASYTFLRKMINNGYSLTELQNMAASNVLRTEEMVNYFDYSYADAPEGEMFGVKSTIVRTPWNADTNLLVLGIKAKEVVTKAPNNLVFLIDVSGSMTSDDKLPLLQEAFKMLTEQLNENDTVSIVTYAGDERVVLEGCAGNKKETILKAINDLESGGSTNGEAGINRAYQIAEANFKAGGNNRIILASDGDLNVGISSADELTKLVEAKRDSGVFLSVLGFGTGNFRDSNMSAIAQNGNGVYHYIDCAAEAERIFTTSLLSTIYTVAKDVKFQLTFDPAYISEYRLIGYENRLLSKEDFENDKKDAGEVGSGHTLTVCYELKMNKESAPTDSSNEEGGAQPLSAKLLEGEGSNMWIKLAIRYKEPDSDVSKLGEVAIGEDSFTETPDDEIKFIGAVIEASMLIRKSAYSNPETTKLENIIATLDRLTLTKQQSEFKTLLAKLKK